MVVAQRSKKNDYQLSHMHDKLEEWKNNDRDQETLN